MAQGNGKDISVKYKKISLFVVSDYQMNLSNFVLDLSRKFSLL